MNRILILCYIFFAGFHEVGAQPGWPIFRGNQQLTGTTSQQLPDAPKLLSSFPTGDDIKASPVISG
jgi:eukaryotic-like serine/threonine-protein kinase